MHTVVDDVDEYYVLMREKRRFRTQLILVIVADIFHVVRGGGGPEGRLSITVKVAGVGRPL